LEEAKLLQTAVNLLPKTDYTNTRPAPMIPATKANGFPVGRDTPASVLVEVAIFEVAILDVEDVGDGS
jgi:hypothetical protein